MNDTSRDMKCVALKRAVNLPLVIFVLSFLSAACAPTEKSDYFYLYYYHPVTKPGNYMEIVSGNVTNEVREIHITLDGSDVSKPYDKRFHYFDVPGKSGIYFAIPLSRNSETKRWHFNGCSYEILERRTGLMATPPTEDVATLSIIHGVCPGKNFEMRYVFDESRGLIGFATGQKNMADGDESFRHEEVYFLGARPGFGLSLKDDEG